MRPSPWRGRPCFSLFKCPQSAKGNCVAHINGHAASAPLSMRPRFGNPGSVSTTQVGAQRRFDCQWSCTDGSGYSISDGWGCVLSGRYTPCARPPTASPSISLSCNVSSTTSSRSTRTPGAEGSSELKRSRSSLDSEPGASDTATPAPTALHSLAANGGNDIGGTDAALVTMLSRCQSCQWASAVARAQIAHNYGE
jgi:hypothetical protein